MSALPLANCRVVELGSGSALSLCGKMFADFGAEVIKIEPSGGDTGRRREPLIDIGAGKHENPYFAWLNTNKQSVIADLGTSSGIATARALIAQADVLLDSRGHRETAGGELSHAALQATSPALTITGITWFGQSGHYRDFVATDAVVRSLAGLVSLIGPKDKPMTLSDHIGETVGGLTAFSAAMSGLISKTRGRNIDVSVFEANVVFSESHTARGVNGPRQRVGINRFFPSTFPTGIYECADGWLGVSAYMYPQWRDFCDLFGMQEALANPAYNNFTTRSSNADLIEPLFRDQLLERTATEWFDEALRRRLAFMITPTVPQLLANPIHRDGGVFAPVSIGSAKFEGTKLPLNLTDTPPKAGGVAPLAGSGEARFKTERDDYFAKPARIAAKGDTSDLPLKGVRIIDLSMGWAGPLVTRMSADLGAEVIKIEACTYVDWWRSPDTDPQTYAEKLYEQRAIFQCMNHNKKGITLDLSTPEGIALAKRLIGRADAVVQNYSREVLPKLGLGYDDLRKLKSDIILLSMAGFRKGPWEDVRAYGAGLEQASGLPTVAGTEDTRPLMTHYAHGDPVGGLHGAAALMTALLHKQRTGQGQHIDLSLCEAMMTMTAPWIVEQSATGKLRPRIGNRHHEYAPQNCFRCTGKDDWIFISVTDDPMWTRLCDVMGRGDLAAGEYATFAGRKQHEDEVERIIGVWSATQGARDAMMRLQAAGVAAGIVQSPYDLESDPQLVDRGYWHYMHHRYMGTVSQPSPPIRENGISYPINHPSPTLGEFNREVLGGILGLSDAELRALEAKGVIGNEAVPPKRMKAAAEAAANDDRKQKVAQ